MKHEYEMVCMTAEDFELASEIDDCCRVGRLFCEDGARYVVTAVSSCWEGENRLRFRYELEEVVDG